MRQIFDFRRCFFDYNTDTHCHLIYGDTVCHTDNGQSRAFQDVPFSIDSIVMIAELAAIPIESPDVSMITGVTAIFTLLFLQVFISFLSIKSERIKNIFSGTPSIIIDNERSI